MLILFYFFILQKNFFRIEHLITVVGEVGFLSEVYVIMHNLNNETEIITIYFNKQDSMEMLFLNNEKPLNPVAKNKLICSFTNYINLRLNIYYSQHNKMLMIHCLENSEIKKTIRCFFNNQGILLSINN